MTGFRHTLPEKVTKSQLAFLKVFLRKIAKIKGNKKGNCDLFKSHVAAVQTQPSGDGQDDQRVISGGGSAAPADRWGLSIVRVNRGLLVAQGAEGFGGGGVLFEGSVFEGDEGLTANVGGVGPCDEGETLDCAEAA